MYRLEVFYYIYKDLNDLLDDQDRIHEVLDVQENIWVETTIEIPGKTSEVQYFWLRV